MKSMKLSHISLVVGFAVAVMALWAGATPLGVGGDLVVGGWYACLDGSTGNSVATTGNWTCGPCQGTTVRYCTEYGYGCTGGSITVAVVSGGAGYTIHQGGSPPCSGDYCRSIYQGSCY